MTQQEMFTWYECFVRENDHGQFDEQIAKLEAMFPQTEEWEFYKTAVKLNDHGQFDSNLANYKNEVLTK